MPATLSTWAAVYEGLHTVQVLKVDSKDTVLTLTSGGCNSLNLLLHGAGHVSFPLAA